MSGPIAIEVVRGAAIAPHIDELAALRISVFREWPYLYDGDHEYEAAYLADYASSSDAVVVLARVGGRVIGAATAMPLLAHAREVIAPLVDAGYRAEDVYYFGESVLEPAWRGRGIGHAFFDHREAIGAEVNLPVFAFCAVMRPTDHPRRPARARDLTGFWRRRGYQPRPDICGTMRWKDLDDAPGLDSEKPMQFWLKERT